MELHASANRSRQILAALGVLLVSFVAPLNAVVINGSLDAGDLLTDDGSGEFYYDAYSITNSSGMSLDVTITITTSAPLEPYAAFWDNPVLPSTTWGTPQGNLYANFIEDGTAGSGGTISFTTFTMANNAVYHLAVAALQYNPTSALGNYTLTITGNNGDPMVSTIAVPEPVTSTLIGLGLAALCFTRRRSKTL